MCVAIAANCLLRQEQALLQPWWPVEEIIVPNGIFVEQANSRADYRLAALAWVPCNPELRCKVGIGLPNPISQSWPEQIEDISCARRTAGNQGRGQNRIKL